MAALPFEQSPILVGETQLSVRNDRYIHYQFTELSDPDAAEDSWRIHAEGYRAMGFVNDDALTFEGFLSDDIDKARGPYTDYRLSVNPENRSDRATMRKEHLPMGGTYRDLPAYEVTKSGLWLEGLAYLEGLEAQDVRLKELGAMARTRDASPLAMHEIIRDVIQDGIGSNEVWFFSIVSTTFDSLDKTLGKGNLTVIGEDVALSDIRVNPDLRLRPALFHPDLFVDRLVAAFEAADNTMDQKRLSRSILYFTDGLGSERMSEYSFSVKQRLEIQRDQTGSRI